MWCPVLRCPHTAAAATVMHAGPDMPIKHTATATATAAEIVMHAHVGDYGTHGH